MLRFKWWRWYLRQLGYRTFYLDKKGSIGWATISPGNKPISEDILNRLAEGGWKEERHV